MKRIVSLIICVIMLFTFAASALAADNTQDVVKADQRFSAQIVRPYIAQMAVIALLQAYNPEGVQTSVRDTAQVAVPGAAPAAKTGAAPAAKTGDKFSDIHPASAEASVISGGNVWLVIFPAAAALIVLGVVIAKKKKSPSVRKDR